jgi:hypothetical protein
MLVVRLSRAKTPHCCENYSHVAMQPIRRLDIVWSKEEVSDYEKLKEEASLLQKELPDYVKEILRKHLPDKD